MRPKWWVLLSILVAGLSFAGLYYVINTLWPNPDTMLAQPQALFFTFLFFGLGSTTIPLTAYFNHRFARPGWLERDKTRLLRQGAWVGFLAVLLAYLQMIRALNWTIAAVLVGVFILIETFFITRG
ncbi:MAG: hypothetical protein Fur0044_21980 [Anaerolineae bacterium]|nr:hypothetical protein [Anaerolineales bacterium]MCQ3978962.1 hypothetical protein [Anaerolineae bacterium]